MRDAALTCPTTLDAFLDWEERQPERWELVGGAVRMMAGGTGDHDLIAMNIGTSLRVRLRGTGRVVHGSNLKVVSRGKGASAYPDIFVRCGQPVGRGTCTDDPVVIFEVLSESTAQRDLTGKRLAYKALWTLRAIVYVSQDEPRIHIVRRDADGRWDDDDPVVGLHGELALPEIGASLPLAEIYEDTAVAAAA